MYRKNPFSRAGAVLTLLAALWLAWPSHPCPAGEPDPLQQGRQLLQAGQLDEAARAFRQALEDGQSVEEAVEGLVAVRRARGERDTGNQAPPASPADPAMALLDRGEMAAADGQLERARQLWNQALQLRPGWPLARQRLQQLAARPAALAALARERASHRQANLDYQQAVTSFNEGRYLEAARLFQAYLEVFPHNQEAVEYLALCHRLARESSQGSLEVRCQPPAQVWLDGQPMGMTPLRLPQVAAGERRVGVEAHGASQERRVEVPARGSASVAFLLTGGVLQADCQPGAQLWLDGQYLGITPLVVQNLPLGPHVAEVRFRDQPPQRLPLVLHLGRPCLLPCHP